MQAKFSLMRTVACLMLVVLLDNETCLGQEWMEMEGSRA